nr:hypothetical protein [Halovivax ruber]
MVSAGCTDGIVPTPTDNTTQPDTEAPTTVDQYPPGVASNGTLTNGTALLDAHFDATANESIALTQTLTGQNESVTYRYVHGASPKPYYSSFNRTTDGDQLTEEFYWVGSNGYYRVTFDEQTRYSVFQNSTAGVTAWTHDSPFGPRSTLRSPLGVGNYSVNGTVERDGQTFVRLTATDVSQALNEFWEAYEGTVLVTAEGVIYDIDSTFVQNTDNTTETVEESISLTTNVEWSGPPSWVADVAQLSISTVESGKALEIRNTGGGALPANASFNVYISNETRWGSPISGHPEGTITTDARLEPGDAVYVTVSPGEDSPSFALHDDRVGGEFTIGEAGIMGTHENVFYRLQTDSKYS